MSVKFCRICLALGVRVFKLSNSEAKCFLENMFKQSGFTQNLDENHYICYECKALLDKSYNFIRRAIKAQEILFHIEKDNKVITPLCFKQINRNLVGLNLVKEFKYIDMFVTEDNEIKREEKYSQLQEYECKTEIDDTDIPDPLENSVVSYFDKKVDLDFGVNFTDNFSDIDSKLDIKTSTNNNSVTEQLNFTQFNNFDNAIQYEYTETVLKHVKEEVGKDCIDIMKNEKSKYMSTLLENSSRSKKSANKLQHLICKNVEIKDNDDKKIKNSNKSKKQKRGGNLKDPKPYDGCVDSGQQIQQPVIPKYPAKCEHCSYEVPNRTAHFHHYLLEHKDKKYPYARQTGKQFVCQFCGLVNNKKSRHIDHELTHGTVSNFACSQCPKRFVNRHRLQKHTYRTHPLQMLECDYCGKKVKSRDSLMIHLRAHTGERPFKCPLCGAGFAHRGNIHPHIRANHKNAWSSRTLQTIL